ncbi:MAG: hypothetical protein EOO05_14360 [Chitinophagaceae bacterium]|nr:MAG: hypothetical protein EOO05_14360 [Chitinophagaceae bacterium]
MHLKLTCRYMMITGTLLIWTIKFILRPYLMPSGVTGFLMGVAPNFFGSLLISFGAYCFFNGRTHLLARVFRLQSTQDLRFVCLMGFGLVVINEYLQLFPAFGRTFDVWDLVFSASGTILSFFAFRRAVSGAENSTAMVGDDHPGAVYFPEQQGEVATQVADTAG